MFIENQFFSKLEILKMQKIPKCRRECRFLRRLSKNTARGVGGTGNTPDSKLALATQLPPTTPARNGPTPGELGRNLGGTWDEPGANPP